MKAMILPRVASLTCNPRPLTLIDMPIPTPGEQEVLIKVSVCGVCHTELDEIEGRTPPPRFPVIPGHQVVGRVVSIGGKVASVNPGERVGVAWIFSACGTCKFCRAGNENLCSDFIATGRDANGGYAEYMTVPEHFVYPLPVAFSDAEVAPLLCAGAIGYRSLRLTGLQDGARLGLTGFGASGHLVLKMARHKLPQSEIYVFARSPEERHFALELGAVWAGESHQLPPHKLDAIIDTTPVWAPIVHALANLEAGGRLVINAIRKEDDKHSLLDLDYPEHLWREKEIKSVANITRRDVIEFLALAATMQLRPEIRLYPLAEANQALLELKSGKIRGAKVLQIAR
ncbi:zinc-dependent alcohol dehydrogenase family protein [Methylomicrobium sp. Wu6]|uniref:zinc-dependent alcohol dehydrogenase family protein n=1 Tax=Methylomicrobium sp. Wu6 TaxID=3107928 RepID=UPI002DD64CFC|nr:zinc-dependent alcohol dehydrogenase family protein [Methylomicrobium sp. Wu6]MEC4749217.1 zinc-dependent alcohol dehydrogenase family protein [Methylomicrobium sp. Wu6]